MTLRQQVVRFSVVGFTCTVLYMLAFWGLREAGVLSQVANVTSMVTTTIISTSWNRRFTFGVSGRENFWKQHAQSFLVFLLGLGTTALTLAIVYHFVGEVDPGLETLMATGANLSATALRFFGMRGWVFRTA